MRNAYVRKGGKLDSFFFTYNKLLFQKRHTVQLDGERPYIIHSDINFDRDWSVCIDLQVQVQQTVRASSNFRGIAFSWTENGCVLS
jgi:hypothetical protein